MKNILKLLAMFLLIYSPVFSQTAFEDVLRLSKINQNELISIKDFSQVISDDCSQIGLNSEELAGINNLLEYLEDPIVYCTKNNSLPNEIKILNSIGKFLNRLNKQNLKGVLSDKNTEYMSDITTLKLRLSSNTQFDTNKKDNADYFNMQIIDYEKKIQSNNVLISKLNKLLDIEISDYTQKELQSERFKESEFALYFEDKKDLSDLNSKIKEAQSLNGINETALIQALTDFIIKEIEKNLINDFFNLFVGEKEIIVMKKYSYLFPETYKIITNSKSTGIELKNISSAFRNAIFSDLKNFLKNFCTLSDSNFYILFDAHEPRPYFSYLKFCYDIIEKINTGTHPIDIFTQIRMEIRKYEIDENIKSYLTILDAIQESLRSFNQEDSNDIWISFEKIEYLSADEKKIFISRIYKNILVVNTALAKDFIDVFSDKTKIDTLINNDIYSAIKLLSNLEISIRNVSKLKSGEIGIGLVQDYYESLSRYIFDFSKITDNSIIFNRIIKIDSAKFSEITDYFRLISSINSSLRDGKFAALVPDLITILDDEHLNVLNINLRKYIMQYLNIYIELINAKSSEDMEQIITKTAESTGGHTGKLNDGFKVYLNAYGGFNSGSEYIKENNIWSGVFGLSAPIGVEVLFGKSTFGVLASILDIGAPLSYRINGDENIPNTITLHQVFSPGLFVKWSPIEKSAFTILAGFQWAPKLRVININGENKQTDAFRLGLSLMYDIPIIKF